MSKQSNEVMAAAEQKVDGRRAPRRGDGPRPNRDEFVRAKEHAEQVLGLDDKVSDGLRRAMARFRNSPLTLYMEILNDDEQPFERRMDAAERAKPFLHRKLEDVHGSPKGNPDGSLGSGNSPVGPRGPTINLTVNRPQVTVNEAKPTSEAPQAASAPNAEQAQQTQSTPKAFKKPKKAAK